MSIRRGFTLTEMLAVIGIMLILMVTTFGVFTTFAQRAGPDTAVSTIQAMLNGARDYAAANGVVTAVYFSVDLARPEMGSTMKLCYKPVGSTTWTDVRGRSVITLGENMYACRDLPATLTVSSPSVGDARDEAAVKSWKSQVEGAMIGPGGDITKHVTGGGNQVDVVNRGNFYVIFDPAGYLSLGDSGTDKYASDGLTIVQLFQVTTGEGTRVVAFALYPFNALSGTRLIFDF
jgi:prepilin-type N-terminal cleavage/methylation domain-containing protein